MAKPPSRGATHNLTSHRFNLPAREEDGDWLDAREDLDGAPPPIRTTVTIEHPKTIITRNASPDIGFDRSINPYRGCEHGCIYCFARPTHAYHDLSPGVDFESRLFAKPVRQSCCARKSPPAPIASGRSRSAPIPIPTSRSKAAGVSPARSWRFWRKPIIR
jgi:hypothetical protein